MDILDFAFCILTVSVSQADRSTLTDQYCNTADFLIHTKFKFCCSVGLQRTLEEEEGEKELEFLRGSQGSTEICIEKYHKVP